MKNKIFYIITIALFPLFSTAQVDCGCTNCPVSITDNGNFDANIFIENSGPNILGVDNCLQSVCFTVTHTWIGDLDFNLTAPDGTCYIIMGDANNNAGGCGSNCDNLNVCIEVGTGNPAGNGTMEYASFGGGGGGNCVTGTFTMATGVTNPNGPCNTSGTNLDVFNNGTGTVSGMWTLTVGDNCGLDVGYLTDWSLNFCDESGIDCSSDPICLTDPGTYTVKKNGALTSTPVYLCEGEDFELVSNGDYILPADTIPLPVGDGFYTAQLMWLVYNAMPTDPDPAADAAFLNMVVPTEDVFDVNDGTSLIVSTLGCGTYWFVPVAGDDGIGGNNNVANGVNDNGGLNWDKDANGCFLLGTPVQVTYACPIGTNATLDCNPPATINGMDVVITGGSGSYTVVNQGAGDLVSTSVPNGGTANINNLYNNAGWNIDITDAQGCTANIAGVFVAPVISSINLVPALTCPLGGNGSVTVNVNGTSGNGGPYTIVMATDPPTAGTTDTYSNIAGTLVDIIIADNEGCISDSSVTIPSAGHFIDVQVTDLQGELCYGDGNGSATITADPSTAGIDVVSITWNGPSGQVLGGGPADDSQSGMEPGNWSVTVIDENDCEVTIPIVITSPQSLDLYVSNSNEPTCYGYNDGSITVQSSGGSSGLTYSWVPANPSPGNTFNQLLSNVYWAYVTDQNGCQDSVMIDLGQPDSLYADFIIKPIDCFGDSTGAIIVTDVHNNVGNVSYHWNLSGVVPNPGPSVNAAGGLPIGSYILTVQDSMCSNQYEFTLTQNPPLVFEEFGSEPAYCRLFYYQSGNGVVFASASGGVADYDYEWVNLNTGASTNNTTWGGLNPASYQMTVTDAVGCTLVETIELDSVSPIAGFEVISAELDASLSGTAVVCAEFENISQYFANPNNPNADTTFFWELGYGLPWQISHDYAEVFDTCYYSEAQYEVCLVAINKNGCTDTACQILTIFDFPVLIAPNVFTPGEGDDVNTLFEFNTKQVAIVEFECTVYDRWGKEMFVFTSITDGWDGTTKNGKPATDGVYFYTYKATSSNGTPFEGQGTVHLIRGN